MEWFDGFYYTPGWGALMTLVGTLGGVIVTQAFQARSTTKQLKAAEDLRTEERRNSRLTSLRETVAETHSLLSDYSIANARYWHGLHSAKALTQEDNEGHYLAFREVTGRVRSGINEVLLLCRDKRIEQLGDSIRLALGENLQAADKYDGDDAFHDAADGPVAVAELLEKLFNRTRELVSSDIDERPTS